MFSVLYCVNKADWLLNKAIISCLIAAADLV